ncbi:unnamed protein product [Boreogadus saida]
MEQVEVEHGYEYTTRDGLRVAILPRERYLLVAKTSDHWWHVCRDPSSKPFYIPAQYVKGCASPPGDGPRGAGLDAGSPTERLGHEEQGEQQQEEEEQEEEQEEEEEEQPEKEEEEEEEEEME